MGLNSIFYPKRIEQFSGFLLGLNFQHIAALAKSFLFCGDKSQKEEQCNYTAVHDEFGIVDR